ncbi:MAG: hypothetical protein ACE5OP_00600 [Candidatus Glassbacteria bacterium]
MKLTNSVSTVNCTPDERIRQIPMYRYSFLIPNILPAICISTLQVNIMNVPPYSSTIQAGINGTSDGDTVMVAPGIYYEHYINAGRLIVSMFCLIVITAWELWNVIWPPVVGRIRG